jgi:hypothetical protein
LNPHKLKESENYKTPIENKRLPHPTFPQTLKTYPYRRQEKGGKNKIK